MNAAVMGVGWVGGAQSIKEQSNSIRNSSNNNDDSYILLLLLSLF